MARGRDVVLAHIELFARSARNRDYTAVISMVNQDEDMAESDEFRMEASEVLRRPQQSDSVRPAVGGAVVVHRRTGSSHAERVQVPAGLRHEPILSQMRSPLPTRGYTLNCEEPSKRVSKVNLSFFVTSLISKK